MTRSERISWLLGLFLCVGLPLALGYYGLAIAGTGGLAVLFVRISWRSGEENHHTDRNHHLAMTQDGLALSFAYAE